MQQPQQAVTQDEQETRLHQAEVRIAVDRVMAGMDEKMRAVLTLHYEQGLPYAEVALVLGHPEGSLRVFARRGLHALRTRLEMAGFTLAPAAVAGVLSSGAPATAPAPWSVLPASSAEVRVFCLPSSA